MICPMPTVPRTFPKSIAIDAASNLGIPAVKYAYVDRLSITPGNS